LRVRRYFQVLFSLDAAYREAKRERDTVMMRELGWQIGHRRMQEMKRQGRIDD